MQAAADILAIAGAGWLLALSVFMLRAGSGAQGALNRLHFVSAATMLGLWPSALAVILAAARPVAWLPALLVAAALTIAGPAVTHVSAHAAGREAGVRDEGDARGEGRA